MWVKVNEWVWLPDNAEIIQQQDKSSSSKRVWEDWSQRGWWSDNRTTTQEGDRATSHEEAEDDYPAQQKNKHQKMDYAEARRIAQEQAGHESSWGDWKQHDEWPGWQQWQDNSGASDRGRSSTDAWNLHAWNESWPETETAAILQFCFRVSRVGDLLRMPLHMIYRVLGV